MQKVNIEGGIAFKTAMGVKRALNDSKIPSTQWQPEVGALEGLTNHIIVLHISMVTICFRISLFIMDKFDIFRQKIWEKIGPRSRRFFVCLLAQTHKDSCTSFMSCVSLLIFVVFLHCWDRLTVVEFLDRENLKMSLNDWINQWHESVFLKKQPFSNLKRGEYAKKAPSIIGWKKSYNWLLLLQECQNSCSF